MLHMLIESGAHAGRPVAEGVASLAVHVALVGAALIATRMEPARPVPPEPQHEFYLAPAVPHAPAPPGRDASARNAPHSGTVVPAPELPVLDRLPPLPRLPRPTAPFDPTRFTGMHGAAPIPDGGTADDGGPGGSDASIMSAEAADEPPRMLVAGPLRSPAGLEGVAARVLLEFVVDTAGHSEPASIRVIESSAAAFDAAAVAAIARARYSPGRAGGRAVRVLVRQAVVFRGAAAP